MKKLNPFFIFGISLSAILFLYSFHFSVLYPNLTPDFVFMLLVIVCLFWLANKMWKLVISSFNSHIGYWNQLSIKNAQALTVISVIGTLIEGIYSRGFPLLGHYSEQITYGIPTFHIFIVVYISFLITLIFNSQVFYNSTKYKYLIALNTFCLLLGLSRSVLIITFLNCMWIYLFNKKLSKSKKISFFAVIVLCLYIFGIFGNYRSNMQQEMRNNSIFDSSYIFNVGGANDKVRENPILGPFYWSYLYTTSPIANFQTLVSGENVRDGSIKPKDIYTQFVSEIITKRIDPLFNIPNGNQYQINNALNVSTIFYKPYYILGYLGISMMIMYMLILPFIYILLISKFFPNFFEIGVALLNTTYMLNLFDNMFSFSITSVMLIMPFIVGIINNLFKKKLDYGKNFSNNSNI